MASLDRLNFVEVRFMLRYWRYVVYRITVDLSGVGRYIGADVSADYPGPAKGMLS